MVELPQIIKDYLDALPPEAKDRVIEGRLWRAGEYCFSDGARCLRGHAGGYTESMMVGATEEVAIAMRTGTRHGYYVHAAFDSLYRLHGDDLVAAIKHYAAKDHAPSTLLPEPGTVEPEPSGVGAT